MNHRVDHLGDSHPQPVAGVHQHVGATAHRFHTPRDRDVDVAGRDALRGEHHRLQTGPADLVDGQRGDVVPQAALERRLSRRRLPGARRHHVAHDAFVHQLRFDAGAGNRLADHFRAQLRRRQALQGAEKFSGWKPDGADDD